MAELPTQSSEIKATLTEDWECSAGERLEMDDQRFGYGLMVEPFNPFITPASPEPISEALKTTEGIR
jgi:hypothetical protein